MQIKVKKLKENAKLPQYHHPGDVGMDVYAMETVTIAPMEHYRFWHGFALEFPEGYGAIIMDKSSISKAGLAHMGGVFDAGYRGEYNTHLVNLSDRPYTVEEGDKVAQIL
ncbi:MAG: dUTP diphosphatase, partial [Patescibacteria group bacterium]